MYTNKRGDNIGQFELTKYLESVYMLKSNIAKAFHPDLRTAFIKHKLLRLVNSLKTHTYIIKTHINCRHSNKSKKEKSK